MAVGLANLACMGPLRRAQLIADLATHGGAAVGLTIAQVVRLVGDTRRGQYLHAWLRHRGVTPPEAPRPSRRPRTVPAPPAPPVDRPPDHVVFGDCHAAPDQDLTRFRDMGRIVRAEYDRAQREGRRLVVVQIGDWTSYDALCSHETLARRGEARVRAEIEAGEAALAAFHAGLGAPAGLPGLDLHLTLGNHDVRLERLADSMPWLEGLFITGAAHAARGWTVHPFLQAARLDGIRYVHYLTARGSGRAIGGVNHARSLLQRVHYAESVVVGHSHHLQYHTEANQLGRRVHGIVAGCWLDQVEEYAGEDNATWFSGHLVLREVRAGDFGAMEIHRRG
jgi:hypothetical protein